MTTSDPTLYATISTQATVGLLKYDLQIDLRAIQAPAVHARCYIWNVPAIDTAMKSRRIALSLVFNHILAHSPRQISGLHDELGHAYPDSASHIKNLLDQAVWRQTAGCSCGCSPGFILKGFPFDVYATFTPAAD